MSDYFTQLNYTLANEDTKLEVDLLPENAGHVLTVAGSGSRVIPLLSKKPKTLSIVDFSFQQLHLTKLRIETLKMLSHSEFLAYWGYPSSAQMSSNDRIDLLEDFDLSKTEKDFCTKFLASTDSPIYGGRYERMLQNFSKAIQLVLGDHIEKLKSFESHNEFNNYLYEDFPWWRWKFLVKTLGNATMLNGLLYKGNHPHKNINLSFSQYFEQMFNALFRFQTPRDSFFLQMLFFGEIIDIKGAPVETDPEVFLKMKEGLKDCDVHLYQGDFFSIMQTLQTKVDFVSFSDILSYFPDDLGEVYLQRIKGKLNSNALTVHRYYLHVTKNMDCNGYERITNQFLSQIHREQTQIYLVDIYQREPW